MFVIADNRHEKVPSYFVKVAATLPLISVELRDAQLFATRKEAIETHRQLRVTENFEFNVFELGIVKKIN